MVNEPKGKMSDQHPQQFIMVVSELDGRKFKMVMRGNIGKLSVEKIKRYLEKSTGIHIDDQILSMDGLVLDNTMVGEDFGLFSEAVLNLRFLDEQYSQHSSQHSSRIIHSQKKNRHSSNPSRATAPLSPSSGRPSRPLSDRPRSQSAAEHPSQHVEREVARRIFDGDDDQSSLHADNQHTNNHPTLQTKNDYRKDEIGRTRSHDDTFGVGSHLARKSPDRNSPGQLPRTASATALTSASTQPNHQRQGTQPSVLEKLKESVNALEDENVTLKIELQKMADVVRQMQEERKDLEAKERVVKDTHLRDMMFSEGSFLEKANEMLYHLSVDLGLVEEQRSRNASPSVRSEGLAFDDMLTCVVGGDNDSTPGSSGSNRITERDRLEDSTLLITVDPPTERLYIYTTLFNTLPVNESTKLMMYEKCLEWAMLGRDIAGGGVGIDPRNNLIMLHTTIDLRHCGERALADTAPVFIEAVVRWRKQLCSLMNKV